MLNEDTAENCHCQAWKTVESNNLDYQLNNTNLETMFSSNSGFFLRAGPADQVTAYAKVYIGNTCLSDYIAIEPETTTTDPVELVTEDPVEIPIAPGPSPTAGSNVFGGTEADENSAASNVWGFSLSMFAVAGLSAVILSV